MIQSIKYFTSLLEFVQKDTSYIYLRLQKEMEPLRLKWFHNIELLEIAFYKYIIAGWFCFQVMN